jgi:hypothetical protein
MKTSSFFLWSKYLPRTILVGICTNNKAEQLMRFRRAGSSRWMMTGMQEPCDCGMPDKAKFTHVLYRLRR